MSATPRLGLPEVAAARLAGRTRTGPPAGAPPVPPARTRPAPLPASLRIVIAAPRTDIGGGARILFEHANRLARRGHRVTVVSHLPAPGWFPLQCPFVEVPTGVRLVDRAPVCDLLVAGYWDLVEELARGQLAPVVHVEQGDAHLFEDLAPARLAAVRRALGAADHHTAVSEQVREVLGTRYGTDSTVVPNAVDRAVFSPAAVPAGGRRSVLCVGWDGNAFKGLDEVREVAALLRRSHPDVDVVWVSPKPPAGAPGAIARVVVAPAQDELAGLYRSASAYLCASRYESFGLPAVEAMACGTPVVTTDHPGSREYAHDGQNALVVPVRDAAAMHAALARLLDDGALAARCRAGGLATADGYAWEAVVDRLEEVYRRVAEERAPCPDDAGWDDVADLGAAPESPAARERLLAVRRRSGAARLLVPVRRTAFEGHEAYQWEVAATRPGGRGECRVLAPHTGGGPLRGLPYQRGYELFLAERFPEALAAFTALEQVSTDRAVRGALVRWTALCLFELGRQQEALARLAAALQEHPDDPDLYYLVAVVGLHLGMEVDLDRARQLVDVLGQGSRYADWLAHPTGVFAD